MKGKQLNLKNRVCFVASNPFKPDPRAEKQMLLLSNNQYQITGIGWDRASYKDYQYQIMSNVIIQEIGIKSSFGSGMKNLWPILKFNLRLFKKLFKMRKSIDIVHSVNLDTGLTCLLFAKFFKKRLVYDIYDYYVDAFPVPKKLRNLVRKIENLVINKSDLLILPIDSRRKQISGSNPKKTLILYNTPNEEIETISNQKRSYYQANKINISFVGALVADRFLEELLSLTSKRTDIFLHIAGFGNKELVDKIQNGNNQNVHFYGKVSHKEGLEISNMADLMVAIYNPSVPNHRYSAPNKFYEALFLGKPIVVAKKTGIDELVEKYNVGHAIDYSQKDFNRLFDSLDKSKFGEFKANNQSVYKDHFSWEKMEEKLLNAYRSLSH